MLLPLHPFFEAQVGAQKEEVGLGHIQRVCSLAVREMVHALFPPRRDWEYWSPDDAQEAWGIRTQDVLLIVPARSSGQAQHPQTHSCAPKT